MLHIEKKQKKLQKGYYFEPENVTFMENLAKKNNLTVTTVLNSIIKSARELYARKAKP